MPRSDTYIEKESSVNEQIDRMRDAATRALLERDDVIIVASVSCIYGIASVETYTAMTFGVTLGEKLEQRQLIADLVALQYRLVHAYFVRGTFRVRGDTVDVFPAHYEDRAWRVSFFGDEVQGYLRIRPAHRQEDGRSRIREGAVMLEELDELFEEIRQKYPDKERLREEAIQVGAMAMKFIMSIDHWGKVEKQSIEASCRKCRQCAFASLTADKLAELRHIRVIPVMTICVTGRSEGVE